MQVELHLLKLMHVRFAIISRGSDRMRQIYDPVCMCTVTGAVSGLILYKGMVIMLQTQNHQVISLKIKNFRFLNFH